MTTPAAAAAAAAVAAAATAATAAVVEVRWSPNTRDRNDPKF